MASGDASISFEATVIYWRGPAPWFYTPLPAEHAATVRGASRLVRLR